MQGKFLEAEMKLINNKTKFECKVEGKDTITVDYIPPYGDGEGYTSLELFLISLGTCIASTVKILINGHLKKEIKELKLKINGDRRENHPTYFKKIKLSFNIHAENLTEKEFLETLKIAESSLCPVWNMMGKDVEVESEIQIR